MSQWAILCVRSLCSLSSLVICTVVSQVAVLSSYNSMATVSLQIVCQVALLPSYNSKATVSLLCSLPVPIYSDFTQFIWIFPEFICIFEWKERVWEHLGTWFISAIFPHRSRIHTRWLLQELMDNDITIEEGEEYNNEKDIKYWYKCHKLHLAISLSILQLFLQS